MNTKETSEHQEQNLPRFELSIYERMSDAEPVWKEFEQHACVHVYQLFECANIWFDNVGQVEGYKLHIVEVRNETGECVMLVPLCYRKFRFGVGLCFVGEGMFDYLGPLVAREFAETISEAEFQNLWQQILAGIKVKIDFIWLDQLPAKIGNVDNPFVMLDGFAFSNSAHALDFPAADDWPQCAMIVRSRKTIKNIERRVRKLSKNGPLELFEYSQTDQRKQHMANLISLKVENLNETRTLHRFDRPEISKFFVALVSNTAAQPNLLQFELKCGGKLVASLFAMMHRDTIYYQISAFNRHEFSKYSPGLLLLYEMFGWSFSRGITRFDMTIGNEDYKNDWINDSMALKTVTTARTLRGKIEIAVRKILLSVKQMIKRSPWLQNLVMKLLGK